MRNNRGITLIAMIVTLMILGIIAGTIVMVTTNTYEGSNLIQFDSYMQTIQKKVDLILEEGTDYMQMGKALGSEEKSKLQKILDSDTKNLIETNNVDNSKLRYFNSNDIYNFFELSDINDAIVVNFENREIISLKGVEKNKTMHYVRKGL